MSITMAFIKNIYGERVTVEATTMSPDFGTAVSVVLSTNDAEAEKRIAKPRRRKRERQFFLTRRTVRTTNLYSYLSS